MKGFWAVPKRGAEVGGILIGNVVSAPGGDAVVTVNDYERVTCEHRRGPSYVLSEPDRKRLARALRRGGEQTVVGYFRSHTRPGLYLDENDMSVVGSFFSGASDVVLLVRPHATAPATAGFFVWEQGDIRRHTTYQEFPFDTAALAEANAAGAPAGEAQESAALCETEPAKADFRDETETAPIEPEQVPAEGAGAAEARGAAVPPPYAPSRHMQQRAANAALESPRAVPELRGFDAYARDSARPAALRLPRMRIPRPRPMVAAYALVMLAALGLLEYQIISGRERAGTATHVASLRVDREGTSLTLRWNPAAPAVKSAESGVLEISEPEFQRQIALDRSHLALGRLAYSPVGNDVTFRLELHQRDRKVSEAVRVITGEAPQAMAPGPQPKAAIVADIAAKPPKLAHAPEAATGSAKVVRVAGAAAKHKAASIASQSRRRPRAFVDDGL